MANMYKVGVEFLFDSNAVGFFGSLNGHFLGLNRHLTESQNKINGMAKAISGLAVAAAGVKALKFEFGLSQDGAELQHRIALMQRQGQLSSADTNMAVKAAYQQAAATPAAGSVADEVGLVAELKSQMPNMATAVQVLPFFAQLKEILGAYSKDGSVSDTDMLMGLKAIESRGHGFVDDGKGNVKIDPAAFKTEGDALERAIISSGGLFTARDAYNMVRQAGPAARGLTADAFFGQMSEMAVIMGASRAGTAMFSMYQQLFEGTMTPKVLGNLLNAHLVDPKSVEYDKNGKPSSLKPGGVVDSNLLYTNPIQWLQNALATLRKQHPHDSDQQLYIAFSSLFGRQTTQREALEAVQAAPEFANKLRNYQATAGTSDNAAFLQANDPTTVMSGFTNAWETMLQALGSPLVQPVNKMLIDLTHVFSNIAGFAAAHPTFAKNLSELTAGLSGIAIALGGGTFIANVGILGAAGTAIGSFAALASGLGLVAVATIAATKGATALETYLHKTFPSLYTPDQRNDTAGPFGDQAPLDPGLPSWLGGRGGWWFNNSVKPPVHNDAYVTGKGAVPHVTNVIYLDGKEISANTVQHISYGLDQQQTGVSGYDTSMHPALVVPAHSI